MKNEEVITNKEQVIIKAKLYSVFYSVLSSLHPIAFICRLGNYVVAEVSFIVVI